MNSFSKTDAKTSAWQIWCLSNHRFPLYTVHPQVLHLTLRLGRFAPSLRVNFSFGEEDVPPISSSFTSFVVFSRLAQSMAACLPKCLRHAGRCVGGGSIVRLISVQVLNSPLLLITPAHRYYGMCMGCPPRAFRFRRPFLVTSRLLGSRPVDGI